MKYVPGETICGAMQEYSRNFKRLNHIKYFSNYSGIKLEINNRRKSRKFANTQKLNYAFLNRVGQRCNYKGNQRIFLDKWKWKHNIPKFIGCNKLRDNLLREATKLKCGSLKRPTEFTNPQLNSEI